MANIPLPKTPDVKSATGFNQVDPSTGSAPYRALVGLGGAISETGKTFDMFADKRQKLLNDAAESQLDLEMMRANGEIDEYAIQNPQDPDSIRTFADDRLGRVWDNVDRKKVDGEAYQLLNQKYAHQAERTKIGVNGKVTQMEVQNANAVFYNQAEAMRRAGDPQAAFDALKKMSVSDAELHDKMEKVFSEGVSYEVGSRIQSAFNSTDIEKLEALKDELEAKDGGKYSAYEYTIKHNGKDVAAGGLSIGARRKAIEEIGSKINRLEYQAVKGFRDNITEWYGDGKMSFNPNLPIDVREKLEDALEISTGKKGKTSAGFMEVSGLINKALGKYSTAAFGKHEGLSDGDREKLWKQVNSDSFSEPARMMLQRKMLAVEQLRSGRDEERGNGFLTLFYDPNVPQYKQDIKERLVNRYSAQADLISRGLGEDRSSEQIGTFYDAMEELEKALKSLDEEKVESFISNKLNDIWNTHMNGVTRDALDKLDAL